MRNVDAADLRLASGGAVSEDAAPARLTPQRYKVQFTASEEHVKLVEQAKALLSHSAPHAGLDEIHLRAMRALVAELERQKYAVSARPRARAGQRAGDASPAAAELATEHALVYESESVHPRQRGRHVPAAIRRAVYARDEARCTYASDSGQRCRETHGLELHHSTAFARGGAHSKENLTLRCRAHNTLAAEEDFGSDFIESARDSTEHEIWAAHDAGMRGP
jgi:hypothetical protein